MGLFEANELLVPQEKKKWKYCWFGEKNVQQFQHSLFKDQMEIVQMYSFLRYFRMLSFLVALF